MYGYKYWLENAFYKRQVQLLIKNFKTDKVTYIVTFDNEFIVVEYNKIDEGKKEYKTPYAYIKRVVASNDYYNIIGTYQHSYFLPIDKKGLTDTTEKEFLDLLKSKHIPIYIKGKKNK